MTRRVEIALVLGLLAICSVAVFASSRSPSSEPGERGADRAFPPSSIDVASTGASLSFVFLGDTHPGGGPPRDPTVASPAGADTGRAWNDLHGIVGRADFAVASLEAPLMSDPPERGEARSRYWADARTAPALLRRSGIDAVALGNDHVVDFGPAGLAETIRALEAVGIAAVGAGSDATESRRPLRVERMLDGEAVRLVILEASDQSSRTRRATADREGEGPVVRELEIDDLSQQIAEIAQEDPEAIVVAYPHWGRDHGWRVSRQRSIAHRLIEAGADLVIGHGAHMLQQIEQHRGKWIVYGLGDFVFASAGSSLRRDRSFPYSLVARLQVTRRDGHLQRVLRLYPIRVDDVADDHRVRFVDANEMAEVFWELLFRSYGVTPDLKRWMRLRRDDFGSHFELALDTPSEHREVER